jgi:hypothetical protein
VGDRLPVRSDRRELREADDILVLADGRGTTREHRGLERTTVTIAERLSSQTVPPLAATLVARETERLDRTASSQNGAGSSPLSNERRSSWAAVPAHWS